MRLHECYIQNFGGLHEARFSFDGGLNVICENNGYGKSTLAAFVKAMLYGLPANRRADLDENERKRYTPWQGGTFGGSMTFSARGKTYRAERVFSERGKGDRFLLYDLSDNLPSNDFSEHLGEELFGIDAAAYERSAYLPQKVITGGMDNVSVSAKLNDLIDATDDINDFNTAYGVLDRQRQVYKKHGGKGRLSELEEAMAEKRREREIAFDAKARAAVLSGEAEAVKEEISRTEDALRRLREAEKESREAKTRAAQIAHGKALLAQRDALVASVAAYRRLLGDAYPDEETLTSAIREAKTLRRDRAITDDRIRREARRLAALREEGESISLCFPYGIPSSETAEAAASAEAALLMKQKEGGEGRGTAYEDKTRADALLAAFGGNVPTEEALDALQEAKTGVEAARLACRSGEEGEDIPLQALPAELSDEQLSYYLKQAAVLASIKEQLAGGNEASAAVRESLSAIGCESPDALPTDETLSLWETQVREATQIKEQLTHAREQAGVAGGILSACPADLPDGDTLLSVKTIYEGLAAQKAEIEALEARQQLSAERVGAALRRRRLRLTVGVGLVTLSALLCFFAMFFVKPYFYYIAIPPAVAGLACLIAALLSGRGTQSEAARAEEEAEGKRLCERKAAYETDKNRVYEFLDRYAQLSYFETGDRAMVEETFRGLSEAVRTREMAEAQRKASEDREKALLETLSACHETLADCYANLGLTPDTEEDALSLFLAYRDGVVGCRRAIAMEQREEAKRAEKRIEAEAVGAALDGYLDCLAAVTPEGAAAVASQDYMARLMAWKTQAGRWHQQISRRKALRDSCQAAEEALSLLLMPYGSPQTEDGDVLAQAEVILGCVSEYRAVSQRLSVYRATEAEKLAEEEALRDTCDAFLAKTDRTRAMAHPSFSEYAGMPVRHAAELIERYGEIEAETLRLTEVVRALARTLKATDEGVDAFLARFPQIEEKDPDSAIERIEDAADALHEQMPRLKEAMQALRSFCTEREIDVEALSAYSEEATSDVASAEPGGEEARLTALLAELQDRRMHLWKEAENASSLGEQLVPCEEALTALSAEYEAGKHHLNVILGAMKHLEEAKAALSTRYLGVMQERFRVYYRTFTGCTEEEAERLTLDATLSPAVDVSGARRTGDYMSRGYRDILSLCVRLALMDALYRDSGEMPFLILDDPFINLDADHLQSAKELLAEMAKRCQIAYFVCHPSRA